MTQIFRNTLSLLAYTWLVLTAVVATSNPAHADVNTIVERMLQNIYPKGETSFHAGLKICEVSDSGCVNGRASRYDRKVRIYLGNIKSGRHREHSTLVDVYFPERQRKTILHDGNKLYLLLPTTKTPIRIPPQQTLLGDADVGAILDIDYSIYKARELTRNRKTITIEFTAPTRKQQFPRIVLKISLLNYTPISGDFFSSTGSLIRHAEYLNVGKLGSRTTFRRVVVDSLLTKNTSVTLIDYIGEDGIIVPNTLFRKSKMTAFRSKY